MSVPNTICCKQTHLSLNNNLLLRLPEYFKDPERFIPERWARDGLMDNVHPYLLLPFSFGVRTCAGQLLCKTLFLASVTYSKRSAIDSAFPIVCHCVCLSVCNVRKILQDLFKTPDRPGMGFGSVAKTA